MICPGLGRAAAPDLVVDELKTAPSPPVQGQTYRIKATVRNQGQQMASAGSWRNQEVFFYVDGNKVGETEYDDVAPGQSVTVESRPLTARMAGRHTLWAKADGHNEVSESNEDNNERTQDIIVTPPPVDLVVEDLWTEPAPPVQNHEYRIRARVRNQGTIEASAGFWTNQKVFFYVDGKKVGEAEYDNVPGGQPTTVESPTLTAPLAGPHSFDAIADATEKVSESNEANNERIETLTVAAPDLIVEELATDPSPPVQGQSYKIKATVKNQGDAAARAGFWFSQKLFFYVDDKKVAATKYGNVPAGESLTVESPSFVAPSAGEHPIKAKVDATGRLSESNNENNELTQDLSIVAPTVDLVVDELWTEPTTPVQGKDFKIKATVGNRGNIMASGGFWFNQWLYIYVDGKKIGAAKYDNVPAGHMAQVESPWFTAPPAGTRSFDAKANATGRIPETNTENNDLIKDIVIAAPDLVVTDVSTEPSPPVQGERCKIKATVKNEGNAAASAGFWSNQTMLFYVDGKKVGSTEYDDLQAGQEATVESPALTAPAAGAHAIQATADATRKISESNELNNEQTKDVTVNPPPVDLIVEALQTEPPLPAQGQTYRIKATVKNQGTVMASAGFWANQEAAFYVDGKQVATAKYDDVPAGKSTTVESPPLVAPQAGTHPIAAKANANYKIAELNLDNNERTETISVNRPPS
ncbi:MAG: hypothetical protein NTW86_04555 [Candidatus Sumerlaeota bacterium]|nr:hypothetical protein [Candidatus Sumerlaeota bacterium]